MPKKKYYPHIYFESKAIPGRDSVYAAVLDIGKPGVRTSTEVKWLCAAQLADLYDGYTRDHKGRKIRFTAKLWSGRLLVLRLLASKYGGKTFVQAIAKAYKEVTKYPPKSKKRREVIVKVLKKVFKLSKKQIEELLRKVNK